MEKLPVELIQHICSHFCLHCQLPGSFAHGDTWQVRESKKALASLSGTCSGLRAIAQPVLFHYFATGKMIHRYRQDNLPKADSQLSLFVRSAIQRPDLAARVKALQLVQSDQFAADLDAHADCVAPILDKARRGLSKDREAEFYLKHHIGAWLEGARDRTTPVHHWLIQIVLLLVPNLETLSVARDYDAGYEVSELGNVALPALRTLALQPWKKSFHIHEARMLFAAAPNLEVLYAVGCGRKDPGDNPNEGVPFALSLGNLRKLVIADLELYDLEMLLPACSQLEELQYIRAESEVEDRDTIPLKALASVQGTLRVLKFKFTDFRVRAQPDRTHPRALRTIESFKDFLALRELVVEQVAVPCPMNHMSNSAALVNWLPPSIERVQFRDVKSVLFVEYLGNVASEVPTKLPNLRSICITPRYLSADREQVSDFCQSLLDRVTHKFDRAGITFMQVNAVESEREPWLDSIYPDLAHKAKQVGYESL